MSLLSNRFSGFFPIKHFTELFYPAFEMPFNQHKRLLKKISCFFSCKKASGVIKERQTFSL